MADPPTDDERERRDDLSKLELPALRLPGLGRRRRSGPTRVEPAPAPPPAAQPAPPPAAPSAAPPAGQQAAQPEPDPPEKAGQRRAARRAVTLPAPSGRVVAPVGGLVVGGSGAVLTYLSLRGCEVLRGTQSCGGPGLFVLLAIVVVMVLLGGVLLRATRLSDPVSTSILGVGVICVVVLLTLTEELGSTWMFLVLPLVGAASFMLAHWVTTTYVEQRPEPGPEHDVR